MKLNSHDVIKGKHDGEVVWACKFYKSSLPVSSPAFQLKPTKVVIKHKSQTSEKLINLSTNYTQSFLQPVRENNEGKKQVINIVHNKRELVKLFTTQKECIDSWNDQIEAYIKESNVSANLIANQWNERIIELKRKITMNISHYDQSLGWICREVSNVQYIACGDKYKSVTYYDNITLLTEQSLTDIAELNSCILQTHRSYAVNVNHVSSVNKQFVTMTNGMQIPISRRYSRLVNEVLS